MAETVKKRLAPDERRAQLLELASELLAEEGADALRIPALAEKAGVTRPVVYRFFPNRQAIVAAILEQFADEMEERFREPLTTPHAGTSEMVRHFVDVTCDTIEARGPGAWFLLSGVALDSQLGDHAKEVRRRLTEPWRTRVAMVTQADDATVLALSNVLVASSRAVLRLWLHRRLNRAQVADTLVRVVRSVLEEFKAEP